MMIISIDTETKGLDANPRSFAAGAIARENKTVKLYSNRKDMWERILSLGKSEYDRKKILNVYAHNMNYDFHVIADINDPNLRLYSTAPFIAAYKIQGKETVKFLDTMAIFPMSLADAAILIGKQKLKEDHTELEKLSLPQLKEYYMDKGKEYLMNDTLLVMELVLFIKAKLNQENINIKRLYTQNQISVQYLIRELQKMKLDDIKKRHTQNFIFYNKEKGEVWTTKGVDKIHDAYRGGRVEAFRYGVHEHQYNVDVNSLYPSVLAGLEFPDLRTERYMKSPLKNVSIADLSTKIGVATALMRNDTCKLGLLPVRTPYGNYFPTENTYMIGTWTLKEIEMAIWNGYTLLEMEDCIIYENTHEMPFYDIINRLYALRKSGNEFDNYFYKMVMNAGIGKMAQRRHNQEILCVNMEEVDKYLKEGYERIDRIGYTDYIRKEMKQKHPKKYYMPIVPAYVNAIARIKMYNDYVKTGIDHLSYTDTDSIIADIMPPVKIGTALGEYKVKDEDERIIIYGRKNYAIGKSIHASGVHSKNLGIDSFEKGIIECLRMQTLLSLKHNAVPGEFVKEIRDLNEITVNSKDIELKLNQQKIYIDKDLNAIDSCLESMRKHITRV